MNVLIKALRNGKGTDERLENIDFKLKQIQQKYNSLIELKSFDKDTFIVESSNNDTSLSNTPTREFAINIVGIDIVCPGHPCFMCPTVHLNWANKIDTWINTAHMRG